MKKKGIAGTLALFFGIFGVHRFYLGNRFLGVLYFAMFFITLGMTVEGEGPIIMLPAILAFVDAILLFVMPEEDFDERYNKKYLRQQQSFQAPRAPAWEAPRPAQNPATSYKQRAIAYFRDFDYEAALENFLAALSIKSDDPATHFNLACTYSMLCDTASTIQHLERAVALGFSDIKRIHTHEALRYVRDQPEFDDFVRNGYKRPDVLPLKPIHAQEEDSATAPPKGDDLLEQILKLGELRDQGILSDEEFDAQKQKILRER